MKLDGAAGMVAAFEARFLRERPAPAFNSPSNPKWLVLKALLQNWVTQSRAPVVIVPIPTAAFIDGSANPRAYQARFSELGRSANCTVIDPLPAILTLDAASREALWSDVYRHLSSDGHAMMAALLAPQIEMFMRERRDAPAATSLR